LGEGGLKIFYYLGSDNIGRWQIGAVFEAVVF